VLILVGTAVMASFPRCDIFSGDPGADARWIESTDGLANAKKRMQELAAEKPGKYFILYSATHMVVASIETFGRPTKPKSESSAA